MVDYSRYTDEELERIAGGEQSQEKLDQHPPGFLRSLAQGYGNYAKGFAKGAGQAIGDLGASVVNWPISGIERLTGKNLPHVPHPNLISENPDSLGEKIGQMVGQFGAGVGLPGGAGFKAAQLAEKGYQTLRTGKKLPLIAKLLAGGAGGALEGAAGNESNRGLGAGLGAAAGTAGFAIPAAYNLAKSISSRKIAKNISEEVGKLSHQFNERFTKHLEAGEESGANKFLNQERANIKLLKKAGEGKLAYGLEKFNHHPTLTNAHKAQSDLNKIVSKYSRSRQGSIEADVHDEALKLKNRMLKKISEAFEKSGAKEHGVDYQQSRVDYANEMAPYLDSPAISALLGRNKRGVQTVRPKEFADKLLKEEEFLAQVGHKHPELFRREKINNIKKSHLASSIAAGTAGATAAAFLPYEIRRLLGH